MFVEVEARKSKRLWRKVPPFSPLALHFKLYGRLVWAVFHEEKKSYLVIVIEYMKNIPIFYFHLL